MLDQLHVGMNVSLNVIVSDAAGIKNLSGATVKKLILTKPDNSVRMFDTYFLTDGTDGVLVYITQDTDIDQPGWYNYQVYLEFDSKKIYSNVRNFRVYPNLG